MRVVVRPPRADDAEPFLAAVRRSRTLHHPWVAPPHSVEAFHEYVARGADPRFDASLVCRRDTGEIVGAVNASEIVRGAFQSAYLGYYGFLPHAGRGYMREGLALVVRRAFRDLGLHRLEANIQPGNVASIALVRALGFRREGLSPRYLKIAGRWRDHERWAILAEDWKGLPRHGRREPPGQPVPGGGSS